MIDISSSASSSDQYAGVRHWFKNSLSATIYTIPQRTYTRSEFVVKVDEIIGMKDMEALDLANPESTPRYVVSFLKCRNVIVGKYVLVDDTLISESGKPNRDEKLIEAAHHAIDGYHSGADVTTIEMT